MLTGGVGKWFQHIINIWFNKASREARYSVPGRSRDCYHGYGIVTMDTDMDTSLRDRLLSTLMPNKVERGGQTASWSLFNIRDNKGNVERLLKKKKLIQHRFNFDSTCFNEVERWRQTGSTSLFNKIERMSKKLPFALALPYIIRRNY